MQARDLTPAMIGQTIRVHDDGLDLTGRLNDLGVRTTDTRTIADRWPRNILGGVVIQIDGHHLDLTGTETVEVTL